MQKSLALTFLLTTVACAAPVTGAAHHYTIMAPATPGGGYDTLAHMVSDQLEQAKVTDANTVINVPGDGGVKGLQQFAKQRGDSSKLIVFGLTTLAALNTIQNPGVSLSDVTPIARLATDYEVLVVPVLSKYKTVNDVLIAAKSGPLKFGGASPGSADQLFTGLLLKSGGVPLANLKWVPSSGNLQALQAMGQGQMDVASVSAGVALDEITAGHVRPLVVSAPKRIPGINAPTAHEAGLEAELTNWRGIFAPAGLSDTDSKDVMRDFARLNRNTFWQLTVKKERQEDAYMDSATFQTFIANERQRLEHLLKDLKMSN